MNKTIIEYPWLKSNETIYYYYNDPDVHFYEMTNSGGIHRFSIHAKFDPRPITKELIDEYSISYGIVNNTDEVPLDVSSIIADFPHLNAPAVNSNYTVESSLDRWRKTIFSLASSGSNRHEYRNVGGYDRVIIIEDVVVVYTGDEYEMISIPINDEHKSLIMSPDLIELVNIHTIKKAG